MGEGPERTALLAVTPQRAGALRARASGPAVGVDLPAGAAQVLQGRDLVAVPYRLGWELAEEVVRYGDAVVVLDPPEVRDAVVRMLRVAATLDRLRRADDTPDVRVADSEEARGA